MDNYILHEMEVPAMLKMISGKKKESMQEYGMTKTLFEKYPGLTPLIKK